MTTVAIRSQDRGDIAGKAHGLFTGWLANDRCIRFGRCRCRTGGGNQRSERSRHRGSVELGTFGNPLFEFEKILR